MADSSEPRSLAWIDELDIPWMTRPRRRAVVAAFAEAIDVAAGDAASALRSRSVLTCRGGLLWLYGDIIGAPRLPGETDDDWRFRMADLYAARGGRGSVAWLARAVRLLSGDAVIVELRHDSCRAGRSPIGPTARGWWHAAPVTDPLSAGNMHLRDTAGAGVDLNAAALPEIGSVTLSATSFDGPDYVNDEPVMPVLSLARAAAIWVEAEPRYGNRQRLVVTGRDVTADAVTLRVVDHGGRATVNSDEFMRVSWCERVVRAGNAPYLAVFGGDESERALLLQRLKTSTTADIKLRVDAIEETI